MESTSSAAASAASNVKQPYCSAYLRSQRNTLNAVLVKKANAVNTAALNADIKASQQKGKLTDIDFPITQLTDALKQKNLRVQAFLNSLAKDGE